METLYGTLNPGKNQFLQVFKVTIWGLTKFRLGSSHEIFETDNTGCIYSEAVEFIRNPKGWNPVLGEWKQITESEYKELLKEYKELK